MKNIVVVTGTRAEYGILKGLLFKLKENPQVNLKIVATAMHLEKKYGETYKVIEEDGFNIDLKIPMYLTDTSDLTILKGMATLTSELADYFSKQAFDLVIVLGDRYEMLSVVDCAVVMKIPVCHLHGGELTLGNYDEFIRHSITKMSHLHLTATEEYRQRVLQLGEQEEAVLNVGSLGVENVVNNMASMKKEDLKHLSLSEKYGVVLFHPETLKGLADGERQIVTLLNALKTQKMQFVFIGSNSDSGSDVIMANIADYIKKDQFGSFSVSSLNTKMYHTLVHYSQFLIGNSSSGLIEVPSLKVPTINLGNRQAGRVRGNTVIDISVEEEAIVQALAQAQSPEFISQVQASTNPYYQENAIGKAYDFIMNNLNQGIPLVKRFVDRRWK